MLLYNILVGGNISSVKGLMKIQTGTYERLCKFLLQRFLIDLPNLSEHFIGQILLPNNAIL